MAWKLLAEKLQGPLKFLGLWQQQKSKCTDYTFITQHTGLPQGKGKNYKPYRKIHFPEAESTYTASRISIAHPEKYKAFQKKL